MKQRNDSQLLPHLPYTVNGVAMYFYYWDNITPVFYYYVDKEIFYYKDKELNADSD